MSDPSQCVLRLDGVGAVHEPVHHNVRGLDVVQIAAGQRQVVRVPRDVKFSKNLNVISIYHCDIMFHNMMLIS